MDIIVKVKDTILKPVAEVFESIVNPEKLSGFFTTRASDPIVAGATITWDFEDMGWSEKISVTDIKFNEHIRFKWHASGEKTSVDIYLKQSTLLATEIIITEEGWAMDKHGVKKALEQTQGWTDFVCSLKAYLYCDIRLREGRPAHPQEELTIAP